MEKKSEYCCGICDKTFSRLFNLKRHLRLIHQLEPKSNIKKSSIICPSCSKLLGTYTELRDHLITTHTIDIYKEEREFVNLEYFQSWKESEERKMQCLYVKISGSKQSCTQQKTYYVCHRSFKPDRYISTSESDRQKLVKSQGFAKLAVTCPSTLELISKENKFKATLFTPHIGHKCGIKHINLTKNERKQIAGKISEGVSFQKILDDIRDGIHSEGSIDRLSILDRQDLRNITRDFSLREHIQLHQNDVISIRLWYERLKSIKEEIPLLFYKAQGTNECKDVYEENDFVLMIMTKFQENQLRMFGSDKICVDSTHGTTNYDFLLTTLMIIDEFGEGVPTAFLISNKVNTQVLTHFFENIKTQTGDIKCKVFMSDDAPEFYNAWTSSMSTPENRLLCSWHVDRNWRKNLNKIKGDQSLKAKVYKSLRILLQTQKIEEFKDLQNFILRELMGCEDTAEFGEYFNTYVNRYELWAYCCRQGLGINTNMYLESMHKVLKHIYFEGKKNRRVDNCLHSLLKLVRDIMIKKLKRNAKGNHSYRMNLIRKTHLLSKNIKLENISSFDKDIWTVESKRNKYIVQKLPEECFRKNNVCYLCCTACHICVHEFSCNCPDFFIRGNLCKHIHAVSRKYLPSEVSLQKVDTEEGTKKIIGNLVGQNISLQGNDSNKELI